jgi:hypothetical protein
MKLNKKLIFLASIFIFIFFLNINLIFAEYRYRSDFEKDLEFRGFDEISNSDFYFISNPDYIEYENNRGSVKLTQNIKKYDETDYIQNTYKPKNGELVEIYGYDTTYNTDVVPNYAFYYVKYKGDENIRVFQFNDNGALDKTYSINKTKDNYQKEIYIYNDNKEKELLLNVYANQDSLVSQNSISLDDQGNRIHDNLVLYKNNDYKREEYIYNENVPEITFFKEKKGDTRYQLEKKDYIYDFGTDSVEYKFANQDSFVTSNRKYFDDTSISYFNDDDIYMEMGSVEFPEDSSRNYRFYKEYNRDGTLERYDKRQ